MNLTPDEPSFVNIPPHHEILKNSHPIWIIKQGYNSNITAWDYFCYHIGMAAQINEKDDFSILLKLKELLFMTYEMKIVEDMVSIEPIIYSCVYN